MGCSTSTMYMEPVYINESQSITLLKLFSSTSPFRCMPYIVLTLKSDCLDKNGHIVGKYAVKFRKKGDCRRELQQAALGIIDGCQRRKSWYPTVESKQAAQTAAFFRQ